MLFEVKKIDLKKPVASAAGIADDNDQVFCESEKLNDVMAMVDHGKSIHCFTKGDWSMHQLLQKLLEKTGPADVWISSYAFSEKPARIICDLRATHTIQNLYCIIDSRVDTRSASALNMIRNNATQLKLCDTHAKITVIKNEEWFIGVSGSANYTSNRRIETACISVNAVIANCFKNLIEDELKSDL
jgi:hypothetical protein